jgi:hypothetical protein
MLVSGKKNLSCLLKKVAGRGRKGRELKMERKKENILNHENSMRIEAKKN